MELRVFGEPPEWGASRSGYGYGSGDGSGYGYGSGDGDGSGYGDGSGSGYGSGSIFEKKKYLTSLAGSEMTGVVFGFWRSKKDGSPANGGSGENAREGLVQEVKGPLELCGQRALHATLTPEKWKGERLWIVALHEPVVEQSDKMGSLKRTIIKDLGDCPFP